MSSKKYSLTAGASRRDFIKTSLLGLGGLAAFSALNSCTTLDEYVFEDQFDLKDQVLIVGGGISGLHLAYKLRQTRNEFRLLEGSSLFGGRIRSNQGLDFGASIFDNSDARLKLLVKEFNLTTVPVSKDHFYISGGAEALTQAMQGRIAGLMPYRSLRLRWKLISIYHARDGKYETVFETPNGRRTITCKKVALTLPPGQWSSVKGLLDLPDMAWAREWLKTLRPESVSKVNYISSGTNNLTALTSKKNRVMIDKDLSVLAKPFKNGQTGFEFEYDLHQKLNLENFKIETPQNIEIEKLVDLINVKTKLGIPFKKLTTESFYDWASIDLIQSSYFKNDVPFPAQPKRNLHFQIFGDYSAAEKTNTVEGALAEAERVSSLFV